MNALENIHNKTLDEMTPLELAIWFTDKGTTAYDMEQAAAELDRLQRIAKAAKGLMDTFDEFGNFDYSSEYVDALAAALEQK